MRLAVCLRCSDLWSTIAGLVHFPLGFYGTFGFLSSSWSLQVYSWPGFLCWLVIRLLCDVLLGFYLLLASVFAHCGGDGWDFVVYSHVILTLDLFVGDMWFLSPYSRSEPAHPRLMESDDVVLLSLFSCSGFVVSLHATRDDEIVTQLSTPEEIGTVTYCARCRTSRAR